MRSSLRLGLQGVAAYRWAALWAAVVIAVLAGSPAGATTGIANPHNYYDSASVYDGRVSVASQDLLDAAHTASPSAYDVARSLGDGYDVSAYLVATNTLDDLAEVGFRSDTSHIFRDGTGHLVADTAENRALIQSALSPESLRTTITLPDGSTLAQYFRTLPNGTQVWAEVRNGLEITNGGLNVIPR